MAGHSSAAVSMYSALDKLLVMMNLHGLSGKPSTVAIQLACRPMDSEKLRDIISAIPESESMMKNQSYIYGTDEEIQLLLKIRAGIKPYSFWMSEPYRYLMRFKQNHNLEHLHLYVRCIIAVFESVYYKSPSRPSTPVEEFQPSPSPDSRHFSSHARSRSRETFHSRRSHSRESGRPQTSRGRHHATHDTPADTHRQRSHSQSHNSYSEWSLGPDSSHSSRRSSRHPSERHAHLAALIHQLKLHTQLL